MFDLAIVGGGPSALSCALTARKRNLSVLVISAPNESSWLAKTERIENYPGLPMVSGMEMLKIFTRQAVDCGTEIMKASCRQIAPRRKKGFMLLCGNDIVEAKAVCLCTGVSSPKLIDGENELLGKGVSWCGTCDGMFYRGKNVAVLSGWAGGDEEAGFLSSLASSVECFSILGHSINDNALNVSEKNPVKMESTDSGILLRFSDGSGKEYDGVFVFRPTVAPGRIISGLNMEGSFITVDRSMRTNIPFVYAAGDCTGLPLQIAKAVGEGNVAAISCASDIEKADKSA